MIGDICEKEHRELCHIFFGIVNWNTRDLLRGCLKSIYENPPQMEYEVFVVDNASTDGSWEMVKREFPDIKLIRNQENLGFARANNQALRESKGKYILLLNPDTIILPDSLDTLVKFMDEQPDVGASGPKILNPDGSLQPSCRSFPTLMTAFFEETLLSRLFSKNKLINKYKMGYWNHNNIGEVDQPMGSALLIRRKVIEQVGLLDEQFYMYYEEVDWCYRMKKAGWKIYFIPQAQIIHYGGVSASKNISKNLIELYHSRYKFFRKHKGVLSVILLKVIVAMGLIVKMAASSFLYLADKPRRKETALKIKAKFAVFRRNLTL